MAVKRTTISEMRRAFDEVIPGYADAWNKAMVDASRGPQTRRRWRWDLNRKYLRIDSERCLVPYHLMSAVAHPSFEMLNDPDAVLLENRGYVSLAVVWFDDRAAASRALYGMHDPLMDASRRLSAKRRGETYEPDGPESFWWTYDGTDFNERCRIALKVLEYIRDHYTKVEPVWKRYTPQDLIRKS